MQVFLIRLLITIGVIWLVQTLLSVINLEAQISRIIFIITVILMLLWLLFGATWFANSTL